MFTGIIEEIGKIQKKEISGESGSLTISAKKALEGVNVGDSIAVNGVCLTVTSFNDDGFTADVMAETLRRSSLGSLAKGGKVNLERAMAANGRFGGHIVSGHIDATGEVSSLFKEGNAMWVEIAAEPETLRYIVEKGSIAIDGVSLTVAKVTPRSFSVSVIPHTSAETTLLSKRVGDIVNLETDIIAKYTEKLLRPKETAKKSAIDREFLAKYGF